jgi:hypothetical protein
MAPKAGVLKKQKTKPKLSDKEQSERFKQTARELGVDESGEEFERTFDGIVNQRRAPSDVSPKSQKKT